MFFVLYVNKEKKILPLHFNKTYNMLNEAGFHSMPFFPRLNIYKLSRVCVAHKTLYATVRCHYVWLHAESNTSEQ